MLKKIIEKSKLTNTAFKFVTNDKPERVIKNILTDIRNLEKIGGNKEVNRIVIQNNEWIILQSTDNGDPIIYVLINYKWGEELLKEIEKLGETLDLNITKI